MTGAAGGTGGGGSAVGEADIYAGVASRGCIGLMTDVDSMVGAAGAVSDTGDCGLENGNAGLRSTGGAAADEGAGTVNCAVLSVCIACIDAAGDGDEGV